MAETTEGQVPGTPRGGTILAFLLADVRGYTRFTFEAGDEAAARLAERFAEVAEDVAETWDGRVIELRGDEVLATFPSARQALRAAVDLQARAAEQRRLDPSLPMNIGIGLDVGEVIPVRDGYRGGALNLAARLCSLAGPGEVLASEGIVNMARRVEGYVHVDRGTVQLKGIPVPVCVFQVAPEGTLPAELPPIQESRPSHPTNLPVEPTPFIGRRQELDAVISMLHRPAVRLVTLIGPGGTGKTRLALQVASHLLDDFPDGVYLVSLAAVTNTSLVPPTIAQALGVVEESGEPVMQILLRHLREKHFLLVLDNVEQVRDAAPLVTELLAGCPKLKVLVTSRATLNEYGEYVFEVPPLAVPEPQRLPDLASLREYESVALFLERARAARAGFDLTPENAPAIAEICRRLDGLPLAIELAAARIRILPPAALLARLRSRLDLLTGGARGLAERHRTLRGTIDWSYELLDATQQVLFARLSVFAGGCTLEAAEAVCDGVGDVSIDVLDGVAALVENSLLRQEGEEEPRFRMLETIREYAAGRLQERGEDGVLMEQLAAYYTEFAEQAEPGMRGAEQGAWLNRLEAEHENLRAALIWLIRQHRIEQGARMAGAVWRFWWARGYLSEGRRWLESVLATADGIDPNTRVRALSGLAILAWSQGELDRSEALQREALALRQELGDRLGIASSHNNLGLVAEQRGDYAQAARWYEDGLAMAREVGDPWTVALILGNLGGALGSMGDAPRAAELGEESLRLWRELGDRVNEARVLNSLSSLALEGGDYRRAAKLQREGLVLCRDLGNQENIAFCLEGAAKILASSGRPEDAARLWGAASTVRRGLSKPLAAAEHVDQERFVERARAHLDEAELAAQWAAGESLTLEEAEDYALRALDLG